LIGLVVGLLMLINVTGFASLVFSLRQGHLSGGLTTLLLLGLLDMFGFWLLKSMREDR